MATNVSVSLLASVAALRCGTAIGVPVFVLQITHAIPINCGSQDSANVFVKISVLLGIQIQTLVHVKHSGVSKESELCELESRL